METAHHFGLFHLSHFHDKDGRPARALFPLWVRIMPSNKPRIFISHINEEKDIAVVFREHLKEIFPYCVDVFLADNVSIDLGKRWLEEIEQALRESVVHIVLCSHQSIRREWIMFEAGAAWLHDSLVIPICHSGLRAGDLPAPIGYLQAVELNSKKSLEFIVSAIQGRLQSVKSFRPFDDFYNAVDQIQRAYEADRQCRDGIGFLMIEHEVTVASLTQGLTLTGLPPHAFNRLVLELRPLERRQILIMSPGERDGKKCFQVDISPAQEFATFMRESEPWLKELVRDNS
jgi:hypothetical protein